MNRLRRWRRRRRLLARADRELARFAAAGRPHRTITVTARPLGCLLWGLLLVVPWAVGVADLIHLALA